MKHLILILSLSLIAGLANAGDMSQDCPFANKSNKSSLFATTKAEAETTKSKSRHVQIINKGTRRGSN